jgi:P-type E1-E2 ATPase
MVKRDSGDTCLAIGDGANDVSMIQAAHIGIGIFGKEGTQAARASDYALQQFRHLRVLLTHHGRYSLVRNAALVQSSFYKNMAFFLTQFWFGFWNGFTAQTLYDDWVVTFFNIVFTSLPPLFLGCFEKDITEDIIDHVSSYC